ncbi:transcription elongation factor 1 homolog [Tenrec ecaudatus]|uniref:transcription elongation factor 1 homolog n=1 Tax=Tenrec ecaudatus TaxID=94439 RepID=UPI003F5AA05B
MGRGKPKQKPPPKKKRTGTLDTEFTCPFCNHPKACEAKMDRARGKAVISCGVCFEAFQAPITHLSYPVDVYNAWVDACEEANQEQPQRSAPEATHGVPNGSRPQRASTPRALVPLRCLSPGA